MPGYGDCMMPPRELRTDSEIMEAVVTAGAPSPPADSTETCRSTCTLTRDHSARNAGRRQI
jgi:hypothetical protein